MLKITRAKASNNEVTLQLDGHVTGQGVGLLRETAEAVLGEGLQLTLDLENICFIECEGVAIIKSLMDRGVRQVKAPLFVVEQLRKCEAAHGD